MPSRHFITTCILIFSSTTYAQLTETATSSSELSTISENSGETRSAPETSQEQPHSPPTNTSTPVVDTTPLPISDPKVEAMQKQIEDMQKQLKSLTTQKAEPLAQPMQSEPPKTPAEKKGTEPSITPLPADTYHDLRKREFSLGWLYNSTISETDASQGGSSASHELKQVEIGFEFARNFSRYEFGAFLSNLYREREDENVNTTIVGALVRFNFVENIAPNNFIPYFTGYLILAGQEYNSTTSDGYEISGNGLGAGFGFNWFPFGEIFAVHAEVRRLTGDLDNNASPKLKVEEQQTTVHAGWRIYF